jgi:hypothetical protein
MYVLLRGGAMCLNNAKNYSAFFSPSQLKKFQEFFHFGEKNGKKTIVNKMPKMVMVLRYPTYKRGGTLHLLLKRERDDMPTYMCMISLALKE